MLLWKHVILTTWNNTQEEERQKERGKEKEKEKARAKAKAKAKAKAREAVRRKNVPLLMRLPTMLWISFLMSSAG